MNIPLIILAVLVLVLTAVVIFQNHAVGRLQKKLKAYSEKPVPVQVSQPSADELEARLKQAYEATITEATRNFGVDLRNTSAKLSEQVSRLTTTVIEEELEGYQKTLEELRQSATQAMDQIHQAVEHQRIELREGMMAELDQEKQQLVEKFEAKTGDVIASYISESLGSGVDLGAQMQFILGNLEKHKDDIRKDLLNGV